MARGALSRRAFIRLVGLAASTGVLVACSPSALAAPPSVTAPDEALTTYPDLPARVRSGLTDRLARRRRMTAPATPPPRVIAVIPTSGEARYIVRVLVLRRQDGGEEVIWDKLGNPVATVTHSFYEALVIDDGSHDQARALARRASAAVLTHATSQGKLAAVHTGLGWALASQADVAVVLHDPEHSLDHIAQIVVPVLMGDGDWVCGMRWNRQRAGLDWSQTCCHALSVRGMQVMYEALPDIGSSVQREIFTVAGRHRLHGGGLPVDPDGMLYSDPHIRVEVIGARGLLGRLRLRARIASVQSARPRPGTFNGPRQREIDRSLPYAVDLLVAGLEGGLSLDAAMVKVAEQTDGPLSYEIRQTLHEFALGQPRGDALLTLGKRVGAPGLMRLTEKIVLADRLGLSITDSLRTFAGEVRVPRR